jgi:hypothetical protein
VVVVAVSTEYILTISKELFHLGSWLRFQPATLFVDGVASLTSTMEHKHVFVWREKRLALSISMST